MGLSKIIKPFKSGGFSTADDAVSEQISQKQFFQARRNFGVNFGGCFVREQWLFPSMFPNGTSTEIEAVRAAASENRDRAREQLENHWRYYINDNDWKWLQDHGITAVRIPVGYWNIDGGNYTSGTKFADYKDIYRNSWEIFKKNYVEPAARFGLAVLVDLHGLPGGANGEAHSGEDTGGKADFWGSSSSQKLMCSALQFVARDLKRYDNICGIQVVNEAVFSDSASAQKDYYQSALKAIREADSAVPVIISDGWWPTQFAEWIKSNEGEYAASGLVVDHHVYRCFSEADKNKDAVTIINDLQGDMLTNIVDNGTTCDFMVGEYSGVLDGRTWSKTGLDPNDYGNAKRAELVSRFLQQQQSLFQSRAPAGNYFWTFKFESGNGGEWDLRQKLGSAYNFPRPSIPDGNKFNEILEREYKAHCDYWNNQNPHENYEHQKYKDGFTQAWNDAAAFAAKNAVIGRRYAVKCSRRRQYIGKHGNSAFMWEWDQGFDKGLQEVYRGM